jgi:hypothetical protein
MQDASGGFAAPDSKPVVDFRLKLNFGNSQSDLVSGMPIGDFCKAAAVPPVDPLKWPPLAGILTQTPDNMEVRPLS